MVTLPLPPSSFLPSFLPSVFSCASAPLRSPATPARRSLTVHARTRLSRPISTGTLLDVIADTQHSEEDTYAMRRLLSPRRRRAATAAATVRRRPSYRPPPGRIHLGCTPPPSLIHLSPPHPIPVGPGPTCLNAYSCFLIYFFVWLRKQHARYAK